METPQVLLDHHLKALRLPTFLREYDKVRSSVPPRESITLATCCGCRSRNCWTGSGGPPSGESSRHDSES
jgi:hypothetical protein